MFFSLVIKKWQNMLILVQNQILPIDPLSVVCIDKVLPSSFGMVCGKNIWGGGGGVLYKIFL